MAESGKNEEVVQMTSALAKLLRQSISNEDEIVTVEREIEYTRNYLGDPEAPLPGSAGIHH